jgi:hypothetical protein
MDSAWIFLSAFFSLLGMAVCVYGRRQRLLVPTVVGVALMGYPYFVANLIVLVGVGALLLVVLVVGIRWEE